MSDRTCSVGECGRSHYARDLCRRCYDKLRRHGDPSYVAARDSTPEEWFWHNTQQGDGCWEWSGTRDVYGYGTFQIDGKAKKAHRFSYELLVGPIPSGLVIDHLCRNRRCVNPSHLEPVTNEVNILRGEGAAAKAARKTHCPQGHPYTGDNLLTYGGLRHCRACRKACDVAAYQRRKLGTIDRPADAHDAPRAHAASE